MITFFRKLRFLKACSTSPFLTCILNLWNRHTILFFFLGNHKDNHFHLLGMSAQPMYANNCWFSAHFIHYWENYNSRIYEKVIAPLFPRMRHTRVKAISYVHTYSKLQLWFRHNILNWASYSISAHHFVKKWHSSLKNLTGNYTVKIQLICLLWCTFLSVFFTCHLVMFNCYISTNTRARTMKIFVVLHKQHTNMIGMNYLYFWQLSYFASWLYDPSPQYF